MEEQILALKDLDPTFLAIVVFVLTIAIDAFRKFKPELIAGREKIVALFLPLVIAVGMKLLNKGLVEMDWATLVAGSLGLGGLSGVTYDKVWRPIKEAAVGIVTKKSTSKKKGR